ncbi:WG repeat-containing protein [Flavobacterium sp. LaA7.5]|nr:WG repeat-containing protein [Flavobacterium salilacus subsp. altitudinum]
MKKLITLCLFIFTLHCNAQVYIADLQCKTSEAQPEWLQIQKDGLIGYIDESGKEIVPLVYNNIGTFGDYVEGWALVEKDGLLGFIDLLGEEIVPPQYDTIGHSGNVKKGWLLVSKDGLYGFIDEWGEEIVKPEYEAVEHKIPKLY